MIFQTMRIGNREITLRDGLFASFRYVYRSMFANEGTPKKLHYSRKHLRPRLFKGHRP